jgi:small subunit ribosomal protein S1
MAALLEEEAATPYTQLRRGDIIEGVVVGTDRDGILVDIGAKSEGVIPPNEMRCLQPEGASRLQVGEKALVFVLQPESPEGQIILSLDRARGEQGWRILQEHLEQNEAFEGYVTGSNKGGLLVNVEGVNAFVPLSQIASGRPERGSPEVTEKALSEWVGRTLTLKVIELNRRRNRAIVSERAAMQEKRAAEKERLLQELNEGEIRTGRIASIRDFGIFVDVGGADGLVHLSELSWERTPKSPHDLFKAGDEVEVYVLKVDQENKKIALSLRRAQPERWEEIVSDFREGQIVPGEVTKLAPFGAFARLEGPIEGLIHISELVDRRINHPREVVDEGDVVPVKIVRIEHDRHRLGLSLRQAHDKAEEDGWMFNDSGGVVSAPPEALARLGLEAPAKPEAEVTEAEAEEPELGSVAAAFAEAEVAAEEARGEAEEAPEAEEPTEAPEAVAEEPEPVEAEAPEADVPAEEEAPEAEEPTEAPEAVAEEPEPVEAGAPEAGVAAEEEAPEAEEAAKVEEGLAEEPETVEAEAPEADVAAEEEAPEAEETTEAPEAVAEEPEPVEAGAPEAEDTTEEPEAGEVEAAEEEADTTGPSEDEEKPPVTESGADALNKEEEVPPAEAESAADEGSEPEEDETSG